MYLKVKPFLLHAVTSVHAGSGSEIGLVDLPIQREKHTGYPKIESSSLKGAIRYTVENLAKTDEDKKKVELVFGSINKEDKNEKDDKEDRKNNEDKKTQEKDSIPSAIAFSDARILLFPVKSMRGIFAWITCPHVLKRFNDDQMFNQTNVDPFPVPEANTVSSNKMMVSHGNIVLEEYAIQVKESGETKKLAEQLTNYLQQDLSTDIKDRIVVLEDDDFNDFVRLSTEVNARIKIDSEKGIVDNKALWYEENVPPETVFYSFLYIGKVRGEGLNNFKDETQVENFLMDETIFPRVFQLGGNSTLGRGLLRKIWL